LIRNSHRDKEIARRLALILADLEQGA